MKFEIKNCLTGTAQFVAEIEADENISLRGKIGLDVNMLEQNERNPAEQWFLMIHKGDKPGDDSGGGFASKQALEWCALNAVEVPADATVRT